LIVSWVFRRKSFCSVLDASALTRDNITLIIQVNGKVRAKLETAADTDKASLEQLALEQPNVQKFIEGKTVRKVIVVPGKLVNIVIIMSCVGETGVDASMQGLYEKYSYKNQRYACESDSGLCWFNASTSQLLLGVS
jgi:hypothetical protein